MCCAEFPRFPPTATMKESLTTMLPDSAASAAALPADRRTRNCRQTVSAVDALKRLLAGNARFVAGKPLHPHEARQWRKKLESGQNPFALILGCSDSRVPPELIFDQGFGDLFVVRVAANVADIGVTASVEFAVDQLDVRLIVVMGHSSCGAVVATVDHLTNPGVDAVKVPSLVHRIEPAVVGIPHDLSRKERIARAVARNVEIAVHELSRSPDLRPSISDGRVHILGAVYDMHTGQVDFLERE